MKRAFASASRLALAPLNFSSRNNLFAVLAMAGAMGRNLTEQAMDPATSPEDRMVYLQKTHALFEQIADFSLTLDATFRDQNKEAMTDPLTGINNRACFEKFMPGVLGLCQTQNRPLAMLAFDIDKFKSVNDTFGHAAGDEVLKIFAGQIAKGVKDNDFPARVGGEEFVVALPGVTQDQAIEIADRLRRAVAERPADQKDGLTVPAVTVSIGVAMAKPDDDMKSLLERADGALYAAKRAGRNRMIAADAPATVAKFAPAKPAM